MSTGDTRPEYYETRFTAEEERFFVHAPAEIAQILRSARSRSALLTAHFADGGAFTLTALLEVAPDEERLLFDMPAQRAIVPRMLAAGPVTFTTNLDGIKIKFQVDRLARVVDGGREALAARLPDAVVRMQRREFFRVDCPVANPPKCFIPYTVRGEALQAEFDVADLSLGGLALVARQSQLSFERGDVHKDCAIVLPAEGTFTTALEVRNMQAVTLRSGQATRVGCRFLQLRGESMTRLQRYTMRIERERCDKFG